MPQATRAIKSPIVNNLSPRPLIHKVTDFLAPLFYFIWILIGLFFLLIIFGQIRQGALQSVIGNSGAQSTQVGQVPTETDLPGVGKVNIACVQSSLSAEAVQKLVASSNASTLTEEERASLAPCIVEAESLPPDS